MGMLLPISCPADNPNCDAQLYGAGDFVFCPKCKQPNPNYRKVTSVEKNVSSINKQQPVIDISTGTIKWQ